MFSSRLLPLLRDKNGRPFRFNPSDPLLAALHRIDKQDALWESLKSTGATDEASYRLMAAIEEAHHSSAIEGAVTTRRESRELIRTGRQPRDRSEQMVLNTFHTVERLSEWIGEPLTAELLCTMQETITTETLDDTRDVGAIRKDDEVKVRDAMTDDVVHIPPPAAELPERIERLCRFANDANSDEVFLHPIARAILLHHQLAYDHPFGDGNGRTARTLFLWSTLRAGYSWFRALSISRSVHKARAQYYRAFRYVQTDEGDATYFVRQQIRCIEQEIKILADFLARRASLNQWLSERDAVASNLNARQLALVEYALAHGDAEYTAKEHGQFHGDTQPTAWSDLNGMVLIGLLEERKVGRRIHYLPSGKLRELAESRPPHLRREA